MCATIDQHRCSVEKLRAEASVPRIAATTKELISALGRAPKAAQASGVIAEALAALEHLDQRMSSSARWALAGHFHGGVCSPDAAASASRALGRVCGQRLMVLLHRWSGALPGSGLLPLCQAETVIESSVVDEPTRAKATKLLARVFAHVDPTVGRSHSEDIERALFEHVGSCPREYKRKARALGFNLSADDGDLLRRVLAGTLLPGDLVRLDADDLAPEPLKAERQEQRNRFFKSEVILVEPRAKRRRDLLDGRYGRAAERFADGAAEDSQVVATAPPEDSQPSQEAPQAAERSSVSGDTDLQQALVCYEPREPPNDGADDFSDHGSDFFSDSDGGSHVSDAEHRDLSWFMEDAASDEAIAIALQAAERSSSSSSSSSSPPRSPSRVPVMIAPVGGSSSSSDPVFAPQDERGDEALAVLIGMGFAEGAAVQALIEVRGSVEEAVAHLCA